MPRSTAFATCTSAASILLLSGLAAAASAIVAKPDAVSTAAPNAERISEPSARKGVAGMVAQGLTFSNAGLPNVDAKEARGIAAKRGPLSPQYLADAARLAASVQALAIDDDQYFGTPRFIRSTQALLTPVAQASARDVLYRFALQFPGLMACDAAEIITNRYDRDFITAHNGVHHLTVIQKLGGVDIVGADLRANVTSRGELVSLSSTLLRRPEGDFAVAPGVVTDVDAVRLATAACGITLAADAQPLESPQGATLRRVWNTPPELRADDALETSFTYFALDASTVRPAWNVLVNPKGGAHSYEVIIDAADGSLLKRHNRLEYLRQTQPMSFRVYTTINPNPGPTTAAPTSTQYPLADRSLITVDPASLLMFSPLGWITDGGTTTRGNNVIAYPDINDNNLPDEPLPDGGPQRIFDFALDQSLAPTTYAMAATTQLFYLSNLYHDRLYSLGFTEDAANFQTANFGRGGAGGDAVLVETQNGANTNNAYFISTGVDGTVGRAQMYRFTGPNPDRDSSLDSDLVYHELTHGTSTRLHRGLNALQSRGMGEGWSDFFAIALNATPSDNANGNIAFGSYSAYLYNGNTNNNYWGIRRYPYSTRPDTNPLTFADIDPSQFSVPPAVPNSSLGGDPSEVHNVGEVWCTMLNECRAGLITAGGFAKNETMLRLVVDSMKLSPTDPTFVQSRDAILLADLLSNNGTHSTLLWNAFAKRGIGAAAIAPTNGTTSAVVESYVIPSYVTFTFPDGTPSQLRPGVATPIRINVAPANLTLTPNSGRLTYTFGADAPITVSMTEVADGQYSIELPASTCATSVSYSFAVGTSTGDKTSPPNPAVSPYRAAVFSSASVLFTDDFETDRSWTVGPNTASTGLWLRGVPIPTAAQPGSGRTGFGTKCFFTGQGIVDGTLGAADVDGGFTTLVSPTINLSDQTDAVVSYYRWYSNGATSAPYSDIFTVDVSVDNGATWTRAETVGPGSSSSLDTNGGWRAASWTFSALGLLPTGQVKLRFIADDSGAASLIEAAIDDVQATVLTCTPPASACSIADVSPGNGDGIVDGNDFVAFINSFATGDVSVDPAADIAGGGGDGLQPDRIIDGSDFIAFINAFAAGC